MKYILVIFLGTGQVSVQTFPGLICRIRAAQRMASVVKP